MNPKERTHWIDVLKGVGILLVLIGHCNIDNINGYIYLFHMPLFYIISGFCWNTEKYTKHTQFKDYFKRKFNSFIIPYFKIAFFCLLFYILVVYPLSSLSTTEFKEQILKFLFGIFIYSRGTMEWLPYCSPIWFLSALFFSELYLFFTMRAKYPILVVLCIGTLGYGCSLLGKCFPWNIDSACIALSFLYLGICLRRYWSIIHKLEYLTILLPLSIVLLLYYRPMTAYGGNYFDNFPYSIIAAIVINVCLMLIISRCNSNLLARIGRNSLFLFGYNYIINYIFSLFFPLYGSTKYMAISIILMGMASLYLVNRMPRVKRFMI